MRETRGRGGTNLLSFLSTVSAAATAGMTVGAGMSRAITLNNTLVDIDTPEA